MKMDKKTVVLTDIDGVWLHWQRGLDLFVLINYGIKVIDPAPYSICERYGIDEDKEKELLDAFYDSDYFENLPPWKDSVDGVGHLRKYFGTTFIGITAIDPKYSAKRKKNLEAVFGKGVFTDIFYTHQKEDYLKIFEGNDFLWIEDHHANCVLGKQFGLTTVLMEHSYNRNEPKDNIDHTVNSWYQIVKILEKV